MKTTNWILAAGLVVVGTGAFALSTNAQQDKKAQEAGASKDDVMPEWSKPGKEHDMLAAKAGHWTFTMKMMGQDGKPQESTGTSDLKMVLGGRFLEDTTKGTMMGQPFEGHGVTGYDRIKNKYTGTWMDSMCTCIMNIEGSWDAASKTMTSMTEMPGPDGKMMKTRIVEKVKDADHCSTEFIGKGPDGKDMTLFSMECTRAK